jgi:hypothetical protein
MVHVDCSDTNSVKTVSAATRMSLVGPNRMRFNVRFSTKWVGERLGHAYNKKFHIWALIAGLAASSASGCGNAHARLDFVAPAAATAGTPFTVTVHVLYQGKPDTVINSHIHFTSSDPVAVLPPDYYFTPADAGSHTFTNGFTLSTPGTQTISGSIFDATGINGSAAIAVSP